jgi:3'(2'), 5'-bisphosphate nucleotidase
MNLNRYLLKSMHAAIEAGNAILAIYRRCDFEVEEKADRSPLTLADRRSHDIISQHLGEFGLPLLSEEGRDIPYDERKPWDLFWLVDPLDGTKEFIKKNGEFTINIALICKHQPVAGVVLVPDKNLLYFASRQIGACKAESGQIIERLHRKFTNHSRSENMSESEIDATVSDIISHSNYLPVNASTQQPFTFTIVGSRSHATPELEAYVEKKRQEFGQVQFISAGSALKFCLVAEGKADIYPRLGPTMEWDTAAGQAIVEGAGGRVFRYDTAEPLRYNKESLLNPWFVVTRNSVCTSEAGGG